MEPYFCCRRLDKKTPIPPFRQSKYHFFLFFKYLMSALWKVMIKLFCWRPQEDHFFTILCQLFSNPLNIPTINTFKSTKLESILQIKLDNEKKFLQRENNLKMTDFIRLEFLFMLLQDKMVSLVKIFAMKGIFFDIHRFSGWMNRPEIP